jgi:poly(ADP-ribose) glycohydrolase
MQAKEQLSEVVIHDGGIEDFYGAIKVDFANKFIGGGVLRHGKVQEEIMFINRPEMYISTLFC